MHTVTITNGTEKPRYIAITLTAFQVEKLSRLSMPLTVLRLPYTPTMQDTTN